MSATVWAHRRLRSAGPRLWFSAVLVLGVLGVVAPAPSAAATGDPVIAVGGDIACPPGKAATATACGQGKTGDVVLAMNPAYVLPLGDSQYDSGTAAEYAGSYDQTGWGSKDPTNSNIYMKDRSRPSTGNHEYHTTGATGYYGYFGANAGDPQKGYYSWDVPVPNAAAWHMIALNSECSLLGGGSISAGCGAGSSQELWLKADLAAHPNVCTVAYWHRPRFSSSSTTPGSTTYTAFWNDLYNAGADVVFSGHAHDYERFAPQTSSGAADPAKGIPEYLVGTGGENFQTMGPGVPNSVVRNASAFGVLKMTLHASSYDFQFMPAAGYALSDSGTNIPCHAAPAADTTKPTAATNVTATAASPNQANVSWTAATDNVGVTAYKVYRGPNGATASYYATTDTNAPTFTDTAVTASTPYTYQVYALDAAGNIGPVSNTASVTTPATADVTPPTPAPVLAVEPVSSNEIDLGWTGSSDAGTGVSGYKVYRKGPGESTFSLLATTAGAGAGLNSYQDTTLVSSSTYQYYVTAYDGASNESAHSNTVIDSTSAGPSSKTFTFATTGDATIQQGSPTANVGTATQLIVDNSPVNDVMMKFNVATPGCDTRDSAKLTLASNSDGSVKGGDIYSTGSNWTESAVNWNNAPTRGVFRNSLVAVPPNTGAVPPNTTVTVDVTDGVTSLNGEADFRISSTSSDGVHYISKEGTGVKPTLKVVCSSAVVPDNTSPLAPAGLNGSVLTSGEVDLSWAAASDNVGVTAYDVYRDGIMVNSVPGDALTYQDTQIAPGTSYDYTVMARDAADNSSPASNTYTAVTPAAPAPPGPPTGLTATPTSSTSVDLAWSAPIGGSSVTGYNIYRGPQGGALIKINSSGTSPFSDATASPGTAYDYAVTSVTTGGTESAQSPTVSATTLGPNAPNPPTGLAATAASSTSVNLTWSAPTSGTSATGYNIYRGSHGGVLAKISSSVSSPFSDTTAVPATTYDYAVTSVATGAPESAPSGTVSATTPAATAGGIAARGPARVTSVTATSSSWTVNLPTYAAGDFVLVYLGNNLGSTAGTPTSSGWTNYVMTNESSGLKGTFLGRVMTGTEGYATIPVTWTGATLGVSEVISFTGVNATSPVDVTAVGQLEASTTALATHTTKSLTTVTANAVLVSGFVTDVAATTWTATDAELADATSGTTSGNVSAALYMSGPVAAGTASRSATALAASVKAVSSLLALRPA